MVPTTEIFKSYIESPALSSCSDMVDGQLGVLVWGIDCKKHTGVKELVDRNQEKTLIIFAL